MLDPEPTPAPAPAPTVEPLAPGRRLLAAASAFGLLYLASPGILTPDGSAILAVLALATWGRMASRPGPRAVAIEFFVSGIAWAGILSWAGFVWPGLLMWLGPGMAVYMSVQGILLRRLAPRLPLAVALPAVWLLSEGVRATIYLPFGFEWMRLGTHFHSTEWLSGSARVWGIGGLSWVLAALAGWVGDLGLRFLDGRRMGRASFVCGLGPAALAALLTVVLPVPETRAGPRVLLVQPNWTQERKMQNAEPRAQFEDLLALTAEGLAEIESAGLEPPELVAWAESMLPVVVIEPGLAEAIGAGLEQPPWVYGGEMTEDFINMLDGIQRNWVDVGLFGSTDGRRRGLLPEGATFVTGAERFVAREGRFRRQAVALLWDAPGTPTQLGIKRHVVPGAESMLGLERFQVVRDTVFELAGYVPDLLRPTDEPSAMTMRAPSGDYRFGISVCFDNAFDETFTLPFEGGAVDFHLVLTNEAWFKRSQEADQMMAFSRLEALATGRSVVRAANSGVTCVLGPDGREVARLVRAGRDREVRGTLQAQVPVPLDPGARTPFVRFEGFWIALWLLLPLGILGAWGRRGRYPAGAPGKTPETRS